MKKLFFLLLLVAGSLSAQSIFNDTMLVINVDRLLLNLEDRIEDITSNQLQTMQSSISPILRRVTGKQLTQQQRQRVRMEVRKAITAELTPAQLNRLKATRKGNRDALDLALSGEKATRKQRQ